MIAYEANGGYLIQLASAPRSKGTDHGAGQKGEMEGHAGTGRSQDEASGVSKLQSINIVRQTRSFTSALCYLTIRQAMFSAEEQDRLLRDLEEMRVSAFSTFTSYANCR